MWICSPPVGVGLLDFKKKSTPSSSLLLVSRNVNQNVNRNVNTNVNRNVNQNVNRNVNQNVSQNVDENVNTNVNRNVNKNVYQNVKSKCLSKCEQNVNKNVNRNAYKIANRNASREPNFRYTTILLKKMKEIHRKMSAENPILGTQRYFWRKWRKMTENAPNPIALYTKAPPHTTKS